MNLQEMQILTSEADSEGAALDAAVSRLAKLERRARLIEAERVGLRDLVLASLGELRIGGWTAGRHRVQVVHQTRTTLDREAVTALLTAEQLAAVSRTSEVTFLKLVR